MWTQKHEDECEVKPDSSDLNNQQFHLTMRALTLHDKRQRKIMTTREDESMNLDHQFPQLLKTKSQH